MEWVVHPSVAEFIGNRMTVDRSGVPRLVLGARPNGGSRFDWATFGWGDSTWKTPISSGVQSFFFNLPAVALDSTEHMVWLAPPDQANLSRVLIAELRDEGMAAPDTAIPTLLQSTEYAAATSTSRKWVVRSQQRPQPNLTCAIRTAVSSKPGSWDELPERGVDEFMCTIAPLDSDRAIVVSAGESGLTWAIANGNQWVDQGTLDPRPMGALHPRFRLRPSGGLWLMWTDRSWVHMSCYADGKWSRGDSLSAAHPKEQTFWSSWCDLSFDHAERPVLVWGDLGFGSTIRDVGSIAFPTDSGWTVGEEIPGSDGLFLTPSVAVDRNGDAWVGIDPRASNGVMFTHTYTKATSSTPELAENGPDRTVSWRLSEFAPETWWAVLRAPAGQPYAAVARVRATRSHEMSWTDTNAPPGPVGYKVRRESVDARFLWESAPASWPPKLRADSTRPPLLVTAGPRGLDVTELVFSAAPAGPLRVDLYNLKGRHIHRQSIEAGGSGRDVLKLESRSLRASPGVYFVRATDALDRVSNDAKVVLLP